MKNNNIYKSWRDKLLLKASENICKPCTDKRKEQYNINYDNPIDCGCRCDRVNRILENVRFIDEDIERYSKE